MVDDSHAVGFMGKNGRGTHEYRGVMGRVDIITGTLGKALGGASGGYTSGRRRSSTCCGSGRGLICSPTRCRPPIVGASLKALEICSAGSTELRDRLRKTPDSFARAMTDRAVSTSLPGEHPIVPIMIGDAGLAGKMAERLLAKGVYVIGFFYPVVPQGKARIRTQVSAAHTREDLEFAIDAFRTVKGDMGL